MDKFITMVETYLDNCINKIENNDISFKNINDISLIIINYIKEIYKNNEIIEIFHNLIEIIGKCNDDDDGITITIEEKNEIIQRIRTIEYNTRTKMYEESIKYKDTNLNDYFMKILKDEIFIENELNRIDGGYKKIKKIIKKYR